MYDMGFPSICCKYILLPFVNKEAASAYSRAEYSQAGRNIERVWGELERYHVAAEREGHVGTLLWRPQPHGDVDE